VSKSAPALAPLFRSEQQLRLLSVLFAGASEELSIGDLAKRAGVAQATASREVARLAQHGLVVTHPIGRSTLVSANWDLRWARDLRSILLQTVGVLGRLGDTLAEVDGVEQAFVFGSWAARYTGEPGLPPRDVDVLVIGKAPLRSVRRAVSDVEQELSVEVNPVVVDHARWTAKKPEPFIAQLKSEPLVRIPLEVQ
jgi:DNA-binding transcriptional ArsR family regulator